MLSAFATWREAHVDGIHALGSYLIADTNLAQASRSLRLGSHVWPSFALSGFRVFVFLKWNGLHRQGRESPKDRKRERTGFPGRVDRAWNE